MNRKQLKTPFAVYLLMLSLLLLGLGGFCGGIMLILDPAGKAIGFDSIFMGPAVFRNYLVPGILLFVFNGLLPLFVLFGLITDIDWKIPGLLNIYKEQNWVWTYSLYAGIVLLTWVHVQLLLMGYRGAIQAWFGLLGIVIVVLSLLPGVKNYYKIK